MAGLGRCDRVFGGGAGAGGEDHVGDYAGQRGSAEFQPEYRWIECQTTGLRAGRERVYAKNHRFADDPADMDGIGRSYAGQQGWELANRMRNCVGTALSEDGNTQHSSRQTPKASPCRNRSAGALIRGLGDVLPRRSLTDFPVDRSSFEGFSK